MASEYPPVLDLSLSGLSWEEWLERLATEMPPDGYAKSLGALHGAVYIAGKPTLLVSFETFDGMSETSTDAQPIGWQMAKALGWSHLCLTSKTRSWFREGRVYGFFDELIDDGFFEEFDHVIFYGAGPCGYAAAAYSVSSPGAQVLAIQPQATLDPRMTEWDDRFRRMRRLDFTTRYGYAPDMLDAADKAFVLYDPEIEEDAMHAALFARSNITRFRMRFMGPKLEQGLIRMKLLLRILAQMSANKLDRLSLARLYRARRFDIPYLKGALSRLEDDGRLYLVAQFCHHVLRHNPGPRFRRALRNSYDRAEEQGVSMPERENL